MRKKALLMVPFLLLLGAQNFAFAMNRELPTYDADKEDLTRDVGSVLVYSEYKEKIYVLLGKERGGRHPGKWSIMLGEIEKDQTTLQASAREMHEETAGEYKVSTDRLLRSPYLVTKDRHFNIGTFFLKRRFQGSKHFREAARKQVKRPFREMSDYAWVELPELRKAAQKNLDEFETKIPCGTRRDIVLRPSTKAILKNAEELHYLEQLN